MYISINTNVTIITQSIYTHVIATITVHCIVVTWADYTKYIMHINVLTYIHLAVLETLLD